MRTVWEELERGAIDVGNAQPEIDVLAVAVISQAISAKRIAAAMERLADAVEVGNGLDMVLHDDDLEGRSNAFVENVCSAISARLK